MHHCECVWLRIIHVWIWEVIRVLLEVNSKEVGSMCSVFTGTMIRINNLTCLPFSPFILFSCLPFDIPVCFHSQNRVYYAEKATQKHTKSWRKPAFSSLKKEGKSMVQQQCMHKGNQGLHISTYTCAGMSAHKQKESLHTNGDSPRKWAGSAIVHNIDHIIYSSLSSYKAIDQIIPYAGLDHCQIAKMGLLCSKRVP